MLTCGLTQVAKRSEDTTRTVWTLVALAVRIARALALDLAHDRGGRPESVLERELRKRLWCTLCVMDLQASFEQASEPLIQLDLSQQADLLPRTLNDADFDLDTIEEPRGYGEDDGDDDGGGGGGGSGGGGNSSRSCDDVDGVWRGFIQNGRGPGGSTQGMPGPASF